MVPQDSYDSPHRRQRWVEAENVGSVTIPGYAVVEVVDSYRPEAGGVVTPNGGRTVLKVRLATTDDPCTTVVIGPCEIPVGESGRVSTIDDPMLALVAADYPNATDVGVEAGSFLLTAGHCGYRIYGGDYDATTQTQRVIRTEHCQDDSMMVRATECILPGVGGTVQPQQWNSTTECWEDSGAATVEVIDPMGWLLAVPGDCFKVDRQNRCGTTGRSDFMPSFPFGMTQLVRVLTQINCGDCGEVTIYRKTAGGSGAGFCGAEATECTFQACNMSYRPISCDAQEFAIAHIIPGQCCLDSGSGSGSLPGDCIAFLMPYPRPMFAKGNLTADMCEGGASLTGSTILDACELSDFEPPTAAGNTLQLHACRDSTVFALWTVTTDGSGGQSCGWEVIQVEDVQLPDWMLNIRCPDDESCGLEKSKKQYPYYGHFCHCDDQTEVWDATMVEGQYVDVIVSGTVEDATGAALDVLTDAGCITGSGDQDCGLSFNTTGLKPSKAVFKTKQICVFCQKLTLGDGADIEVDGLIAVGVAGTPKTVVGEKIDVLTSAQITYDDGSGGSGDGCPAGSGSAGTTLSITGRTKRVCTLCSTDDYGNFEDGTDIDLLDGLTFEKVEAMSDAVFDCTACPTLTNKTRIFWALCLDASVYVYAAQECVCDPCETGSGSGA